MRIGIDCDGVLADFNGTFIERLVKESGRDLFPERPFEIPTWDYPSAFGYTQDEIARTWMSINGDRLFWESLEEYPDTDESLRYLNGRMVMGDDVYFITARPGLMSKQQTEHWLLRRWPKPYAPKLTVLLSARKDLCAEALQLELYVDDRDLNCEAVIGVRNRDRNGLYIGERTRTFVYDQPWNRHMDDFAIGVTRVKSLVGIVELMDQKVSA